MTRPEKALCAPPRSRPGDQGTKANPFHPGWRTPGCPKPGNPVCLKPGRGAAGVPCPGPRDHCSDLWARASLHPAFLRTPPEPQAPCSQPVSRRMLSASGICAALEPPEPMAVLQRTNRSVLPPERGCLVAPGLRPQAWRGSNLLNPGVPRLLPVTRRIESNALKGGVRGRREQRAVSVRGGEVSAGRGWARPGAACCAPSLGRILTLGPEAPLPPSAVSALPAGLSWCPRVRLGCPDLLPLQTESRSFWKGGDRWGGELSALVPIGNDPSLNPLPTQESQRDRR